MTTTARTEAPARTQRVRLWDPLLRGFHWLLATLVICNWLLGKIGPDDMSLHFYFGYTIAALLVFRVIWGFVGPEAARFSTFIRGPGAVTRYFRGMFSREPINWPGHSPMGALSVVAMLLVLIFQVATGLISDPEDYINVGPLAGMVGSDIATEAPGWHELGSNLILILVLLHLAVILFYRVWKNEDLIRPMITGWKWVRRR